MTAQSLQERWDERKAARPQNSPLRIREAANQLGVSELELLVLSEQSDVIRLADSTDSFAAMHQEFPKLGRIMSLTRNEACVHERKGCYGKVKIIDTADETFGLVLGPDIDLRVALREWKHGYVVNNLAPHVRAKYPKSLQFFDAYGTAIQKIYVADEGIATVAAIVSAFGHPEQRPELHIARQAAPAPQVNADAEVDIPGFCAAWDALQNTHDFAGLIGKFGLQRLQALRLAGTERAYPVELASTQQMLQAAAAEQCPIMAFVFNRGNIQIHTGPVHNIKVLQQGDSNWLNVLDPDFNLHLQEDLVRAAWVVKKPTDKGIVTSLELYDADDNQIVTFFGKRTPTVPELAEWRKIALSLPQLSVG